MEQATTVKIIKASAGTGKTYRLSLEFIRLLLRYGDYISYDEILIITFTKKATAEIRQRIFEHMENLALSNKQGTELIQNLQQLDPELEISSERLKLLKKIYHKMLTEKGKLKISTIDSFVFNIFSSIIAPHYNIESPVIDSSVNHDYLPELFESLFREDNLTKFNHIFQKAQNRNLRNYQEFILDLIRNRWQIELAINNKNNFFDNADKIAEDNKNTFISNLKQSLGIFKEYLHESSFSFDAKILFVKAFYDLISDRKDCSQLNIDNFIPEIINILSEEEFLKDNYERILNSLKYWNGGKLLRGKANATIKENLIELTEKCTHHFSDFVLFKYLLQEQREIIQIAEIIYKTYDTIKFRDSIFTYDDISYYTYRFLHDPDISMIDSESILNIFYEFLSYRIRFLLIDEFQDTSVIQWSIIQPIISEIISGSGSKSYGGSILVGDEKQSIYGWRGGERDLLVKAPSLLHRNNKPEILDNCYRYTRLIGENVNKIFTSDILHNFLNQSQILWDYQTVDTNDQSYKGCFDYKLSNLYDRELSDDQYYAEFTEKELLPILESGQINPATTAILTRKNSELNGIAEALDKYNIRYVLESSNSIFVHSAIKPILYLLRYLVIDDIYELLKFLRSDLILISAVTLKSIVTSYKATPCQQDFLQQITNLKSDNIDLIATKISTILNHVDLIGLPGLIRMIIEQFNVNKIYSTQLDLKNIDYFINIAHQFYIGNSEYSKSVEGFLDFIDKYSKSDDYKQVGIDETDAIKLMTIHKSKGLQFETVFLFYNANPRKGNFNNKFDILFQYDDHYQSISPLIMTYNYSVIFNSGSCQNLSLAKTRREMIEELNSIYVALTRVKKNLIIRGRYKLKQGITALLKDIKADSISSVPKIFTAVLITAFGDIVEELDDDNIGFVDGLLSNDSSKDIPDSTEIFDRKDSSNSLELDESCDFYNAVSSENETALATSSFKGINIKEKLNQNKAQIVGTIIHDYLSYIEFATQEEMCTGRKKILMRFGSFIKLENLHKIIDAADQFIRENSNYFSAEKWDLVCNEYVVFDKEGNEKRIDRFMINHKEKEILILDYKTGEIPEDDAQIKDYEKILYDIDYVKENNYRIKSTFIKITLSGE